MQPSFLLRASAGVLLAGCLTNAAQAQTALTWQQVRQKFEAVNPTLQAGQLNIQESKANEITAYLRPNPDMTAFVDQIDPFQTEPFRPFQFTFPAVVFSYLHERQHKRELRLESARQGTVIAQSQQADLTRTLLYNLRLAFVQTLQAKAVLALAKDNLDYLERELGIERNRYQAGDIARVDLDRLELQRVQYASDYETAQVNVRTAKITLITLLNERTPVDQFDVAGPYTFSDVILPLEQLHETALESRPDLQAAIQAVEKARTDHRLAIANGSTDPTFGVDFARNPPIAGYFGVSVSIPLRIFDRNQGEKARTEIDVTHAQRQQEAAQNQVYSDVDSAYFTLVGNVNLLRPYQGTGGYLQRATRVRDDMSFSYQRGQASLLDYLDAQRDYRAVQLSYINLIGAYLTTASQLNVAVGREVIQ